MVVASIAGYALDNKNNRENNFENKNISLGRAIIMLVDLLLFVYALYLSFKCNKGFNLGGFLMACCCSAIYIAYKLATGCK